MVVTPAKHTLLPNEATKVEFKKGVAADTVSPLRVCSLGRPAVRIMGSAERRTENPT